MNRPLLPRHDRYDHSSISKRPDYSWPERRRLAVCITTNIEVFAFGAGQGVDPARQEPIQNQRNYAWRDYGNRVGICGSSSWPSSCAFHWRITSTASSTTTRPM